MNCVYLVGGGDHKSVIISSLFHILEHHELNSKGQNGEIKLTGKAICWSKAGIPLIKSTLCNHKRTICNQRSELSF